MSSIQEFTPDDLLGVYRKARRIHLVDEKFRSLLMSGGLAAVYYSPRGQEVLAAGMGVHLKPTDYIVTTYRGIHDQLAKGIPLRALFAEYFGKVTGACKGKGGAMHITHPETGVMVTTGVVGSGLPIGNGLALSAQLKGEDRVTVVNFGDGASNIGAFHEALNLAAVWRLPVVFLCHNNGFAECTRYGKGTSAPNVADRAAAYGPDMKGVTVNGNDPQAMWEASRDAVTRARTGEGPTLLEAKTFRFMGHYFGDPGAYIPKDEYEAALAQDPMPLTRAAVLKAGAASEAELQALDDEIHAAIEDALAFAKDSPLPEPEEVQRDVYGVPQS